ncbi:MAG TPA: sugar phosphate nucleotidyltransferase [Chloroflexota bacterium]|nr:sugar phosphate nucleotidyltransferase [Chloroflexota bacterium]
MLGIVPAAGAGSRIQPLAFSKEVLPVGRRRDGSGEARPKAVSEFLVERMVLGGADRICFVISPEKTDIIGYYSRHPEAERMMYVVQDRPHGLCDALFRACPQVRADEDVLIGLPDTVWFPADGYCRLPAGSLAFLLFWVDRPELFDVVELGPNASVQQIQVKPSDPRSNWVWGAFRMPGRIFHELHELWLEPARGDEYVGTLVNAYLARGGSAVGVTAGESYFDVGTMDGYRAAIAVLESEEAPTAAGTLQSG